jgi:L-alanine-DL-glutamate epimerase-like enolase superfamily enzyme
MIFIVCDSVSGFDNRLALGKSQDPVSRRAMVSELSYTSLSHLDKHAPQIPLQACNDQRRPEEIPPMDVHPTARTASLAAQSRITITRVETIPLHLPLTVPVKISSGAKRPSVEVLLVRLHTNEGIVGIGETQAWRRQGSSETLASLTAVINEHFSPLILGRSPFEMASIMHTLDDAIYHSLYAQAAISDALFDLQGKILDVPVYQLLGGKCRDRVPSCAVLFMMPTLEETLAGAERFYARGFRSFVVKVGNDLKTDIGNVRAVRERLGDEAAIRVDANASMRFDDALQLLRKIEPYGIDAAEQLLGLWDLDGMAELARRVDIPMITDECVATDRDLLSVIGKRAATIAQTKIAKNGGIWHTRKLWHIADAAGMHIYPGNHPSSSIAVVSMAHLATAWPGPVLDGPFTVGLTTISDDIVTEPVRLEGCAAIVPDAPGLGVTLDEDKIRHFRIS